MPPESDSDSESDSESFHQPVLALSQESDSERIIFGEGISESGSEEISQSNNNEVSSEEQSGTRNIILRWNFLLDAWLTTGLYILLKTFPAPFLPYIDYMRWIFSKL